MIDVVIGGGECLCVHVCEDASHLSVGEMMMYVFGSWKAFIFCKFYVMSGILPLTGAKITYMWWSLASKMYQGNDLVDRRWLDGEIVHW